jgi:hypothetical protein
MRFKEDDVYKFFKGRKVIVLGSAPCVVNADADYLDSFDWIVRTNNYEHFNECKRVDVYYSFFGNSIMGVEERIKRDKPKFLFLKYPLNFCFTRHTRGREISGKSGDFRFVQRLRAKLLSNNHHFAQTIPNFISNFCAIGSIPTTGVAAIFDILRYEPKELHIAGFDFFKSKKHNIDEKWNPKDGQRHDFASEEFIVEDLINNNLIKFPMMGVK